MPKQPPFCPHSTDTSTIFYMLFSRITISLLLLLGRIFFGIPKFAVFAPASTLRSKLYVCKGVRGAAGELAASAMPSPTRFWPGYGLQPLSIPSLPAPRMASAANYSTLEQLSSLSLGSVPSNPSYGASEPILDAELLDRGGENKFKINHGSDYFFLKYSSVCGGEDE
jgi:hypothetical protein